MDSNLLDMNLNELTSLLLKTYTVECRYNAVCISYRTVLTEPEYKSECHITNYTPYQALMGELWGVLCEDSVENLLRYDSTALY